jgi:hypothetical protein
MNAGGSSSTSRATRGAIAGTGALAAGLALAIALVSCGGGAATRATREPSTRPMPEPMPEQWVGSPDTVRARIETLDREIADRAHAMGLEPPGSDVFDPGTSPSPSTSTSTSTSTSRMTVPAGPTCDRSTRPLCEDVCSLADSICDAAGEICKLAGSLPGDAWAAGRCSAGASSCERARERCCGC